MEKIKRWFMFSDESIAYLEETNWYCKPIKIYTSQDLGFGEWIEYN